MSKRNNANRKHLILSISLLLALALAAPSSEYHRDYIPVSQMVADAKEGKVARLVFEAGSEAVGICYDQRCLIEKVTTILPGDTLLSYMMAAGVSNNRMPKLGFDKP